MLLIQDTKISEKLLVLSRQLLAPRDIYLILKANSRRFKNFDLENIFNLPEIQQFRLSIQILLILDQLLGNAFKFFLALGIHQPFTNYYFIFLDLMNDTLMQTD